MALGTNTELVKQRLPYLSSADDSAIASFIAEAEYFLQPQTKKFDVDVETEAVYTPLQRMLICDLAAYNMLRKKIISNAGGVNGVASAVPTFLKTAKADVVEAEFDQVDIKKTTMIGMDTTSLISELKLAICSKARQLHYIIPEICGAIPLDVVPAFKVYGTN